MLKRRDIRRFIRYDKITGLITTKCEITLQAKGYLRVLINGQTHRLTNVVWALVHGSVPDNTVVIQLNKNKLDLRIENLYLDMTKAEKIKKEDAIKNSEENLKARRITKDLIV